MDTSKDTLPSMSVQRRDKELADRRKMLQREFESRELKRKTASQDLSNNAFADKYMRDAYAEVQKSEVTHNEDYLRINGTWFYNKSLKRD